MNVFEGMEFAGEVTRYVIAFDPGAAGDAVAWVEAGIFDNGSGRLIDSFRPRPFRPCERCGGARRVPTRMGISMACPECVPAK